MDRSYRIGFADGYRAARERFEAFSLPGSDILLEDVKDYEERVVRPSARYVGKKPKRKLSKWQKFVKANSKKKQFIYQSGSKKGKLNLKKMGVAYRRSKR